MKIKKVFIKNFKGIKEKKTIDFSENTSLMIGPNGFGKTTVFDVLELCLTGRINRTFEKNVTNDIKDYKKPFYQNTLGEDVVVKVWLENSAGDNLIIVKFLSKDNNGKSDGRGRRNKPCDFELLSTYTESPKDFEKSEFIPIDENKITNEYIDNFFGFVEGNLKVENLYKLFNYLQQEDTTYFLKKSENDRRASLGFLFQTSEQEKDLDKINESYFKLNKIYENIKQKIDESYKSEQLYKKEYNQLFPDKNYEFDKINLFEKNNLNLCKNEKEKYFKELDGLIEFINRFSPDEYLIKRKVDELTKKIKNKELINYYVLQEFIEEDKYNDLIVKRKILEDENKIEAYIVQNYTEKYKYFEDINNTINDYEVFLNIQDYDSLIEELKKYVKKIISHRSEEYLNLLERRKNLINSTNEIDRSISEIVRLRNSINEELLKHEEKIINRKKCPYCGIQWDTYENLILGFVERENELKKISTNQSTMLSDCDKKIKELFIEPIKKYMSDYNKNNNKIDTKILYILKKYRDIKFNFDEFGKYNIDMELVWTELKTYTELKKNIETLKNNIKQKLQVDDELFERIKSLHNISFETEIEFLESIKSRNEMSLFVIPVNNSNKISINDMEVNSKLFKDFLEKTKENLKYDYNKTLDDENIYNKYFNCQKDRFFSLKEDSIILKKEYIENQLLLKQNSVITLYNERLVKLKNIINKMENLKSVYDLTIKEYKKDMINKIKIPFYIYTAKVLQNYQQGMGVFLATKENSDSIRFLTDSSSDHDAMHHLSSGQLAVVSLAFCLAINKTYNISDNLKFLVIDDPVQEMDTLNIHSFVELIRHEFIDDYQLIFSTHNDFNALFIKYKLEKINENSVKMINVQNEFFNYLN